MRHFVDAFRALKTTLGNVFRRPVTVQYPRELRPRAERFRASFALLHDEHGEERCIGCLQCERICPSGVIQVTQAPKRESRVTGKKRGFADGFTVDASACLGCELCVQVCPTDALIMTREPDVPVFAREDLVLTMARLYDNEKNKPAAWANSSRLLAMQEAPKPEKADKAEKKARPAEAPAAAPAATPESVPAAAGAAK
jgi:NADH-quinone oxidoreductase subunit I